VIIENKPHLHDKAAIGIKSILESPLKVFQYVDLFKSFHAQSRASLKGLFYQGNKTLTDGLSYYLGEAFAGQITKRLAGRSKQFFFASTSHIFLKFLSKFRHILPPTYGTLSQLRTIGPTIDGQHLVYMVFWKGIYYGACLDRTQTFHQRYLQVNHLYKLYAEEMIYLHENHSKLSRHACSFDAHFAPSSDLLWCPNNNDGGERLHMVEEAIENAMVPLMVVAAKRLLRHTGEKCFVQLMMIPNFGRSLANNTYKCWLSLSSSKLSFVNLLP
jgi:hypothetical protein